MKARLGKAGGGKEESRITVKIRQLTSIDNGRGMSKIKLC